MKFQLRSELIAISFTALLAIVAAVPASAANTAGARAQMVITAQPAHAGGSVPQNLDAHDVIVVEGKTPVPVVGLQRLTGDLADMQLFILLDDSTRISSLSLQLADLKAFIRVLPATTQVAVGYMRNGTFTLGQAFTADRPATLRALRLPEGIPGENGSPYFVLSDLARHWPSKTLVDRRAVLVLTDGVDRYYDTATVDDPYVDSAIKDSLQKGIAIYSIYLRGAGRYGRSDRSTLFAQSRLLEVSQQTGGYAYFQAFDDPVTIQPFLKDLGDRFGNQYELTFAALKQLGIQPLRLRTESPALKIEGPTRIYVR